MTSKTKHIITRSRVSAPTKPINDTSNKSTITIKTFIPSIIIMIFGLNYRLLIIYLKNLGLFILFLDYF